MESIHKLSKLEGEELKTIINKVNKRIKKESLDEIDKELEQISTKRAQGFVHSFAWWYQTYE